MLTVSKNKSFEAVSFYYLLAEFLYSPGVIPICFLNVRLKYGTFSNPEAAAISIMLSSVVASSRQACLSRLRMMYVDTEQFITFLK